MNEIILITTAEATEILKVSRKTLKKLMQSEGFPVMRVGRSYRIDKAKLYKWIENGGVACQ